MVFLKFLFPMLFQKPIQKFSMDVGEVWQKKAKMKKMFENNHLYECVTIHEFGQHFFTWSWISIYPLCMIPSRSAWCAASRQPVSTRMKMTWLTTTGWNKQPFPLHVLPFTMLLQAAVQPRAQEGPGVLLASGSCEREHLNYFVIYLSTNNCEIKCVWEMYGLVFFTT